MTRSHGRFSVVVPTCARPERVARCLEALASLDYPGDAYEVVVVDDGGGIPLARLVKGFTDRLDVRLLEQRRSGPAAARNAGAAHAGGTILAFTDDDCEPAPDWLLALDRCFANKETQVVGGTTVNALAANPYSTASQVVVDSLYEHYNADRDAARFFTSNNLALPAALFRDLGGFDTSFPLAAGEDRDLSDRCVRAGYRMTYAPDARVFHSHELSAGTLWSQHFGYGRGTSVFHRVRNARVPPEPGLHATMARLALSRGRHPGGLRVAASVLLTQIAYTAGFAYEELRSRRRVGR
jgi:GT2 family glycosyltransferase